MEARRSKVWRIVLGVSFLLVAVSLLYGTAYWNARTEWKELVERRQGEQRRHAAENAARPAIGGPPIEADAAEVWERLVSTYSLHSPRDEWYDLSDYLKLVRTSGRVTAPPPSITAILARRRGEIEDSRRGARCVRSTWLWRRAEGAPDYTDSYVVSRLLVAQGHAEAAAGHRSAALRSYLAALRFACDLTPNFHGMGVNRSWEALKALEILVTTSATASDLRENEEVARGLDLLEPFLPSPRLFLFGEGLFSHGEQENAGFLDRARWAFANGKPAALAPMERLRIDSHERVLAILELCVDASSRASSVERRELFAKAKAESVAASRECFLLAKWEPTMLDSYYEALIGTAIQSRLVRAAIAVERGENPTAFDPCEPSQPIRVERHTDGSYRIWSVGLDGRDDGGDWKSGEKDDVKVERTTPRRR